MSPSTSQATDRDDDLLGRTIIHRALVNLINELERYPCPTSRRA
jgi:hypothetical protein